MSIDMTFLILILSINLAFSIYGFAYQLDFPTSGLVHRLDFPIPGLDHQHDFHTYFLVLFIDLISFFWSCPSNWLSVYGLNHQLDFLPGLVHRHDFHILVLTTPSLINSYNLNILYLICRDNLLICPVLPSAHPTQGKSYRACILMTPKQVDLMFIQCNECINISTPSSTFGTTILSHLYLVQ